MLLIFDNISHLFFFIHLQFLNKTFVILMQENKQKINH